MDPEYCIAPRHWLLGNGAVPVLVPRRSRGAPLRNAPVELGFRFYVTTSYARCPRWSITRQNRHTAPPPDFVEEVPGYTAFPNAANDALKGLAAGVALYIVSSVAQSAFPVIPRPSCPTSPPVPPVHGAQRGSPLIRAGPLLRTDCLGCPVQFGRRSSSTLCGRFSPSRAATGCTCEGSGSTRWSNKCWLTGSQN